MRSLAPSTGANSFDTSTPTSTTTTTTPLGSGADGTGGTGGLSGLRELNCSGRNYIVNVPTGLNPAAPAPLVAFFHGFGDDYENFANTMSGVGWMNSSNANGYILMIPDHMNPTRESFLHFDGDAFNLAATQSEMNSVMDCILNHAGARYNISRSRIHWVGFSEGGSFANLAANILSQSLRTVVPVAGAAGRQAPARNIPLHFVVGRADGTFASIDTISNQWSSQGHTVERSYVNGVGHSFSTLMMNVTPNTIWSWMRAQ